MKEPSNHFYVTTPIYYVTARPHLGSLYSTLLADVFARWHALRGKQVFFLTGTDEHGQKIAQAAQAAGQTPKNFVDSFIESYQHVWQAYAIDYTRFIRTTDTYHVKAVQEWIKRLQKSGDIYKSFYRGWYCTPDETFVTLKEAQEQSTTVAPQCPSCGRQTVWVEEETYNFRLSAYQERLLAWYRAHPDFIIPKERINEVISFVEAGLRDLSISRTTVTWGIPFPDDTAHVTYVWADALNNYITAIGYLQEDRQQEFHTWWPADVQVLGKDIVRFHAVYWPAFLMASGLELPRHLLVHGWIKVNQQKMSKSLGNVVDPLALRTSYGSDQVRYYLMRYMAVTHDSDFSTADLERAINTDLADDLGNLLNRVIGLATKNNCMIIEAPSHWPEQCKALQVACTTMLHEVSASMDACMVHMALAALWKYINQANAFVHSNQPWKLAKTDPVLFNTILSALCHSLYTIGAVLSPFMPEKTRELFAMLGVASPVHGSDTIAACARVDWRMTFTLTAQGPLFNKIELQEAAMIDVKKTDEKPQEISSITIDDLNKVELRVGIIRECQTVAKSDKLLQLLVDFGSLGNRQILSGIRAYYKPEELIGRRAVFVVNLAPRAMMGLQSHGMVLTAQREDGTISLVNIEETVPAGTRLR